VPSKSPISELNSLYSVWYAAGTGTTGVVVVNVVAVVAVVIVTGLLVSVSVTGAVEEVFFSAQPAENNVDIIIMLSRMGNAGFMRCFMFFSVIVPI
jgi:hypothetical protein